MPGRELISARSIAIFLSGGNRQVTNPTEMCERRQRSTDGAWQGRWNKLHCFPSQREATISVSSRKS